MFHLFTSKSETGGKVGWFGIGAVLVLVIGVVVVRELRRPPVGDDQHGIFHALSSGNSEAAKQLAQDEPAALRATDPTGATPLHLVAAAGRRDLVESFLAGGADPNAADTDGWTPLIRALEAPGDQKALVQTLLASGAKRDLSLAEGQNILHLAGFFRKLKPDVVPLIVPDRSALSARDASGLTPREVATREGNKRVAAALARLEAGGGVGVASVRAPGAE
jgi:ankyrin repeat protein